MALPLGFDDRGGVHARPRAEGIGADDRVVHRNWYAHRIDRGETIDQPHAAITMTVPINFYWVLLDDFLLDEFYQRLYAVRRRMPDRIREANPSGAARNRGTVQSFDRFRTRASRILGH